MKKFRSWLFWTVYNSLWIFGFMTKPRGWVLLALPVTLFIGLWSKSPLNIKNDTSFVAYGVTALGLWALVAIYTISKVF